MIDTAFFSRHALRSLAVLALAFTAGCVSADGPPPPLAERAAMPAAVMAQPDLSGADIIAAAHDAAGGRTWVRPTALKLTGYNLIHQPDGVEIWDRYTMWRVYADEKPDAHTADGRVRIEAWSGERQALLLSFDGAATYTAQGRVDDPAANARWSSNFGFGAIRNALDEGWAQTRLPDDLIDGAPAYMVELTDPVGGATRFGVRQADFAVVYVGFDTPRGWHERRYSHFFSKPGVAWRQPGRVRLFYDGVKANEAIWTDFELSDTPWPQDLFVIAGPDDSADATQEWAG